MKTAFPIRLLDIWKNGKPISSSLKILAWMQALVLAVPLNAASGTWLGGTSSDWNDSANWVSGNLPNDIGDWAIFNSNQDFDNPNLSGDVTLQRLRFDAGSPGTTITGNSKSLTIIGAASNPGIVAGNGAANTLDLNVHLTYNNLILSVASTSSLTFAAGNTLTLDSANTALWLQVQGGGTVNVNAALNHVTTSGIGRTFLVNNCTLNFNPSSITGNAIRLAVQADGAGVQGVLNLQRSLTTTQVSVIQLGSSNATTANSLRLDGNGLNVASTISLLGFVAGEGTRSTTVELDRAGTNTGTFSGGIINNASTAAGTLAFSAGDSDTLTFSGLLNTSGQTGTIIKKIGAGTVVFSGASANNFGAALSVEEGVLFLQKTQNINAVNTAVSVDTEGALRLGAANQIANTASLTLKGGTLDANGFSETLGFLILDGAGSVIDFGAGTNTLLFADGTYTSGSLTIYGWNEEVNSWRFASDPTAFVNALGSNLAFDGFGAGGSVVNLGGGQWEVVAVPESSSLALLLGGVGVLMVLRRKCA